MFIPDGANNLKEPVVQVGRAHEEVRD